MYVDDEGLVKGTTAFFRVAGHPDPLPGRGLVVGIDEDGENISAPVSLDELRSQVSFVNPLKH